MVGNFKRRLTPGGLSPMGNCPGQRCRFHYTGAFCRALRPAGLAGILGMKTVSPTTPNNCSVCAATAARRDYFQRINTHCGMIGWEFN